MNWKYLIGLGVVFFVAFFALFFLWNLNSKKTKAVFYFNNPVLCEMFVGKPVKECHKEGIYYGEKNNMYVIKIKEEKDKKSFLHLIDTKYIPLIQFLKN